MKKIWILAAAVCLCFMLAAVGGEQLYEDDIIPLGEGFHIVTFSADGQATLKRATWEEVIAAGFELPPCDDPILLGEGVHVYPLSIF